MCSRYSNTTVSSPIEHEGLLADLMLLYLAIVYSTNLQLQCSLHSGDSCQNQYHTKCQATIIIYCIIFARRISNYEVYMNTPKAPTFHHTTASRTHTHKVKEKQNKNLVLCETEKYA